MNTKLPVPVVRNMPATAEIRSENTDGPDIMEGHFSVFNSDYEINSMWEGHFIERVAPGAFKKTLSERADKVRVLLEHGHDPQVGDKPLGRPVRMEEDDHGAAYTVELFDTSYVRDLKPALEAGVYGSSFRFQVIKDEWTKKPERSESNPNRIPERTITEVKVIEFGPTVFPASGAATSGLRSGTDEYYDKLRSRQPDQYEHACRSVNRDVTSPDQSTSTEAASTDPVPAATPSEEPRTHSPASTSPSHKKDQTNMFTVEERAARQDEIRTRLTELDTEYAGSVMPEAVTAEWDELSAEYDEHERAIKETERRRARLTQMVESGEAASERGTDMGAPAFRKQHNPYDLTEIRSQARSPEDMASLLRDNAMRAVESHRFTQSGVRREDAQANVERLLNTVDDSHGTLARRVLSTGSPTYERAFGKFATNLGEHGLNTEERAALALGAGSTGGYAVPFQLDPTVIMTNDGRVDPIRAAARVERITGKEWQGITTDGVSVSRSAEASEVDANEPSFEQPTVKTERVTGFVPYSFEIEMTWAQLGSELTKILTDAKAQEEADSFVNGDGTGLNPGGILGSLAAAYDVETEAANTVEAGDIYKLEGELPPRFRGNSVIMASRSVYNAVRQFDTYGGAQLWERIGNGMPAQLLGYAAHEASEMPAYATADGTRLMVMGDFRNFLIVDRIGMNVELVPHLLGPNRRPTGQRGLLAVWHNNSKILVPNAFRALKVQAATP